MNKNVCFVHLCLSLLVDITATEDYHMMRPEYNVSYIKDLVSSQGSLPGRGTAWEIYVRNTTGRENM